MDSLKCLSVKVDVQNTDNGADGLFEILDFLNIVKTDVRELHINIQDSSLNISRFNEMNIDYDMLITSQGTNTLHINVIE